MFSFRAALFILVLIGLPGAAPADEMHHGTASGHSPIGVTGDHAHGTGEVMLGWRAMYMGMKGSRDGTSTVPTSSILDDYTIAPLSMDMEMHMLGAMYAPNDRITLMAMVPWVSKVMDLQHRTMGNFRTRAKGIGDIRLSVLRELGHGRLVSIGVSLPTGAIDRRDATPMSESTKLPYPMQLGSGTFDLLSSITVKHDCERYHIGAQFSGAFRLGRNSEGYSLGDRGSISFWVQRDISQEVATSVRLIGNTWADIDGSDGDLTPSMTPAADAGLRAGDTVDLGVGLNLLGREGGHAGHRLALELSLPLYRRLDGPQLETDWQVTVGWQHVL